MALHASFALSPSLIVFIHINTVCLHSVKDICKALNLEDIINMAVLSIFHIFQLFYKQALKAKEPNLCLFYKVCLLLGPLVLFL